MFSESQNNIYMDVNAHKYMLHTQHIELFLSEITVLPTEINNTMQKNICIHTAFLIS